MASHPVRRLATPRKAPQHQQCCGCSLLTSGYTFHFCSLSNSGRCRLADGGPVVTPPGRRPPEPAPPRHWRRATLFRRERVRGAIRLGPICHSCPSDRPAHSQVPTDTRPALSLTSWLGPSCRWDGSRCPAMSLAGTDWKHRVRFAAAQRGTWSPPSDEGTQNVYRWRLDRPYHHHRSRGPAPAAVTGDRRRAGQFR